MEKMKLNILFGEQAVRAYENHVPESPKTVSQEIEEATQGCYAYRELTFDTKAEKEAYLQGIKDSSGWMDWICLKESETLELEKS